MRRAVAEIAMRSAALPPGVGNAIADAGTGERKPGIFSRPITPETVRNAVDFRDPLLDESKSDEHMHSIRSLQRLARGAEAPGFAD
jgi:hypothetical protein